ncbi:hypothetical protein CEV33_0561 [Brucella grignonensis]|uniref:Uncharacterized protein n=1 Tax=Brucella grignonensis TaxID=94627 RepID=A0A256FG19_9HYPH|nr:hypothetical protein CEV33_0561 [Brucella grignonensis]
MMDATISARRTNPASNPQLEKPPQGRLFSQAVQLMHIRYR